MTKQFIFDKYLSIAQELMLPNFKDYSHDFLPSVVEYFSL